MQEEVDPPITESLADSITTLDSTLLFQTDVEALDAMDDSAFIEGFDPIIACLQRMTRDMDTMNVTYEEAKTLSDKMKTLFQKLQAVGNRTKSRVIQYRNDLVTAFLRDIFEKLSGIQAKLLVAASAGSIQDQTEADARRLLEPEEERTA